MTNFKTVEVKGYTKKEALEQVPFQVIKDATQAWKNAGQPMAGAALKDFMASYLEANTKGAEGVGCSITLESGVADTRERPYTIEDTKNTQGKRKYKTGIMGINPETGEILFVNFENKAEAKNAGKDLYVNKGYRGDIQAIYVKEVVEGETAAFKMTYTPSKGAKVGTYLAFGVEA